MNLHPTRSPKPAVHNLAPRLSTARCAPSKRVGRRFALGLIALLALHCQAFDMSPDPRLQEFVDAAVRRTCDQFASSHLRPDQLAVTLVDLSTPKVARFGSHRGSVQVYPASVIKLFYLVAAHRWLEDGKLQDTPELQRAVRDMIVESSNDATHYVVDVLTGTTSGPELEPAELDRWQHQRNAVNRYFVSLGYTNINVNKKPWGDGPYGRETQAIRTFEPRRNFLTTDATARLMGDIVSGRAVTPSRSRRMMELLSRHLEATSDPDPDSEARFLGPALPAGARYWSKAGWTSETRHVAAYLELPDGRKLVLVAFTVDHAKDSSILHELARHVLAAP